VEIWQREILRVSRGVWPKLKIVQGAAGCVEILDKV